MMREDIRRRALRAAAAVSLTLGIAGCAGEVTIQETATTSSGAGETVTSGAGTRVGTSSQAGTGGLAGGGGMAGVGGLGGTGGMAAVGGLGGAGGADGIADAGANCRDASDVAACCEANDWNTQAGCMPWGPPMPPVMEEVA